MAQGGIWPGGRVAQGGKWPKGASGQGDMWPQGQVARGASGQGDKWPRGANGCEPIKMSKFCYLLFHENQ